ncbi:MAG: rhomboid family intramembrane serine protease [Lentisphaeria bacterium]|nr:rhomboid family intramembrane serine protease [Lentisphaeria bacterium]
MSLYDRSYMRDNEPRENRNSRSIIWILIGINAALFLLFAPPGSPLFADLALKSLPESFRLWQLLTAGFLHSTFSHIFFNMWGLYLFGSLVLPHTGKNRFTWLYLVGVLSGNLIFLASAWRAPNVLLGASGAVCAFMMAAAMLEPDRRFVMIFMPFSPIKTSTLVICYTILEIFLQLSGSQSNVSHLAHLGGFIGGYIVVKIWFRNTVAWDPLRRFFRQYAAAPRPAPSAAPEGDAAGPVSPAELDALLDKISRDGINSLSAYELARLRRAREEMRGK